MIRIIQKNRWFLHISHLIWMTVIHFLKLEHSWYWRLVSVAKKYRTDFCFNVWRTTIQYFCVSWIYLQTVAMYISKLLCAEISHLLMALCKLCQVVALYHCTCIHTYIPVVDFSQTLNISVVYFQPPNKSNLIVGMCVSMCKQVTCFWVHLADLHCQCV